jgi:hypothetical protein
MKYLERNLTNEVKDHYKENHKTLKKKIEDTGGWKDLPCSLISRINIVKLTILLNEIIVENPPNIRPSKHRRHIKPSKNMNRKEPLNIKL